MSRGEAASAAALAALVEELGFLPFFRNEIPGFSVEERTPPALWFQDGADGPWEWKGPVIRRTGCAYGKLFRGRAGFVSAAWYPDLANHRRDGYDFDARYEDGLAPRADKAVYDLLAGADSLLSGELKRLGGFQKGFDTRMTRLQMQCYVTTVDFAYRTDRRGVPYGWGLARYATPERHFGAAFTGAVYSRPPQESAARILEHLRARLPEAPEAALLRLLG